MALVYLRHPLHGEKAESNDLISSMDKANGWSEFDPVREAADKAAQVVIEPVKVDPPAKVEKSATKAKAEPVIDFFKVTKP